MPIAHQAYLLLVLCGFLTFGVVLGASAWWTNRAPRKASQVESAPPVVKSASHQTHAKAA